MLFGLAVGVPTGVVPSPLYTRMTPVLWWNYGAWAATAVLGGLVIATYIRRPGDRAPRNGVPAASGGGLLAAFAVGCPVCNKLVVAALGASGALTIWAPLQPVIAIASIAVLGWVLRSRLRSGFACSITGELLSPVPEHPSDGPLLPWQSVEGSPEVLGRWASPAPPPLYPRVAPILPDVPVSPRGADSP